MNSPFPLSLAAPLMLAVAAGIAVLAIAATIVRRAAFPPAGLWLCAAGLAMWCLAAGEPSWQRPSAGEVAVMVDLSPSTRTADFRNRAPLDRRIRALLGKVRYRVYYFAADVTNNAPAGDPLPDIPAEFTTFAPPAGAAAIVLFSDGRFDLPAVAPPTYIVFDPLLETPADAAIASLEVRGENATVRVKNSGDARRLTMTGVKSDPVDVPAGLLVMTRPIAPGATKISARLAGGDPWPENDQLTGIVPSPDVLQRWWVGASLPPGAGWRAFAPNQLPTDPAEYLSASIIALDNVAATDLTTLQQQRLAQYVRDLGGGLAILGGDRAFAAGAYPGSELETLSPLASTPPEPTTHWMIVADASGSMNTVGNGVSLWREATDAIVRLLPHLPPDDLLSIGSFSESLNWWSKGKTVRQSLAMTLPPADVSPHGPTNLEQTLLDIAQAAEGELPKQLLVLTDAEAEIEKSAEIEAQFRQKKIHLHVLAIENGSALPTLRNIARNTGGTVVEQLDPKKWTDSIAELMRAGAPKLLGRDALAVRYVGEMSKLPGISATPWNRVWAKNSAAIVAEGTDGGKTISAGAKWNVGEGGVLALAFDPGASANALADAIARPPRDPRFRVTWESAARLGITVDALDGSKYLNGKAVRIELSAEAESGSRPSLFDVPQTAPGRYELRLPAPRTPTFASLRVAGHLIDRIAVAGRYAPEFDAVGNDHEAMEKLALQTGGKVIPPRQTWPIDFHWKTRPMSLTPWLAMLGAASLAWGLGIWKMRPMSG